MNPLLYLVLGLIAVWVAYLAYTHLAARAVVGRPSDELEEAVPALRSAQGTALVYCYSPGCGPCRSMTREVEALQAEGLPIHKVDISRQLDLARRIGIRATPSTLVVRDRRIERVLLGAKDRSALRRLLRDTGRETAS